MAGAHSELLYKYLRGGKGKDHVDGLKPEFQGSLAGFLKDNPFGAGINSGYRSPERQAELYQGALEKYGSEAAARKWVAPPGKSQHNHGSAADIKYDSPEAIKWAHENAGKYGLQYPLSNENWHVEPIGARGGKQQAPAPAPTQMAGNPAPVPATPQPQGVLGAGASTPPAAAPAASGWVDKLTKVAGILGGGGAGATPGQPQTPEQSLMSAGIGLLGQSQQSQPDQSLEQLWQMAMSQGKIHNKRI